MKKRVLSFLLVGLLLLALVPVGAWAAPVTTVYADTVAELLAAVKSDTRIILSGKIYDLGYRPLEIFQIDNLEIIGVEGTKIVGRTGYSSVIRVSSSNNILISGVSVECDTPLVNHAIYEVIYIYSSENITIEDCDLYGGISVFEVFDGKNVKFNHSAMRDCSDRIGEVYNCRVEFNDCIFKNNGYAPIFRPVIDGAIGIGCDEEDAEKIASTFAIFNDCVFQDNENTVFKYEVELIIEYCGYDAQEFSPAYSDGFTRVYNCAFTNNAWQSDDPAYGADSWAAEELREAVNVGIVPEYMTKVRWTWDITRLAAAEAMVTVIEKAAGKSMEQIAAEKGWDLNKNRFSDTRDRYVTFLKYAGAVTGIGNNKYDPYGAYTRAQAVTMIGRASESFFGKTARGENPFTDVPAWAAPYVGYAAENGITNGVGGGRFNPDGVLTNQETAIFMLRTIGAIIVD